MRKPEIWAIRIRLQIAKRTRNPALFNLAIDSKIRGCGLVSLRLRDVANGSRMAKRTVIVQQRTQQPVSSRSPSRRERQSEHGSATRMLDPSDRRSNQQDWKSI